jgi:hypothetical protein
MGLLIFRCMPNKMHLYIVSDPKDESIIFLIQLQSQSGYFLDQNILHSIRSDSVRQFFSSGCLAGGPRDRATASTRPTGKSIQAQRRLPEKLPQTNTISRHREWLPGDSLCLDHQHSFVLTQRDLEQPRNRPLIPRPRRVLLPVLSLFGQRPPIPET